MKNVWDITVIPTDMQQKMMPNLISEVSAHNTFVDLRYTYNTWLLWWHRFTKYACSELWIMEWPRNAASSVISLEAPYFWRVGERMQLFCSIPFDMHIPHSAPKYANRQCHYSWLLSHYRTSAQSHSQEWD